MINRIVKKKQGLQRYYKSSQPLTFFSAYKYGLVFDLVAAVGSSHSNRQQSFYCLQFHLTNPLEALYMDLSICKSDPPHVLVAAGSLVL